MIASQYSIVSTVDIMFLCRRFVRLCAANLYYCQCSWQTVIQMPEGEIEELPYALKKVEPGDRLEVSQV